MKISKYVIIVMALTFTFISCSTDDSDNPPQEQPNNFEPVTLDLTQVDIDIEDTSFTLQGFNFDAFRAQSFVQNGESFGITLAFPLDADNPSFIELDLSNAQGVSRITSSIAPNQIAGDITFFNGDEIVAEILATDTQNGFEDTVYDIGDQAITSMRIASLEAFVQSITLE